MLAALLGMINHISAIKWAAPGRLNFRRDSDKVLAEDDSFYAGDADAPLLRATHLTAGLSVVVVLILGGAHRAAGWWLAIWWVAVGLLALSGIAALLLRHPRRAKPDRHPTQVHSRGRGQRGARPGRPRGYRGAWAYRVGGVRRPGP